jgi:NADH-quinone oxidoreductase subunit N
MDLSNFLVMRSEISLIAVIVLLLLFDLFSSEKAKSRFQLIGCGLFLLHTVYSFLPAVAGEAFGGMYITDTVQQFVKGVLNIGAFLLFLQARAWLDKPEMQARRSEFYLITMFTLFGMYLMISSGHFLLFYLGLETASIPLAVLVAYNKYKQQSVEASIKYVLSAALSSGVMLYGVSMLYGAMGTMYFTDISAIAIGNTTFALLGLVFFLAGMFFKLSIVPFHLWTADVYQGAPTPVTAYLSVVSKGAVAFVLASVLFTAFPAMFEEWKSILWWLIIVTITVGNLFALRQNDLKRFLAFSSISQAGYILLGVIAGTEMGMATVIYYILVYMFSNFAAFGVITSIENQTGKVKMSDYNGLYATNPKLALVMTLALFSLGGIPFFAGFFSKFFIFAAAAETGQYLLVFIALLNTIISLYYYLLVIKAMYIKESDAPVERVKTDCYARTALVICVAGILFTGLASCIFTYIQDISFGM